MHDREDEQTAGGTSLSMPAEAVLRLKPRSFPGQSSRLLIPTTHPSPCIFKHYAITYANDSFYSETCSVILRHALLAQMGQAD